MAAPRRLDSFGGVRVDCGAGDQPGALDLGCAHAARDRRFRPGGPAEAQRAAPMRKRNLFGVAQDGKAVPVADASPTSGIRLLGILSRGVGAGGRAIFALETGKPKTVEAGSQVVPGLVLKEVHADSVLVARNGSIERMKLDRRTAKGN